MNKQKALKKKPAAKKVAAKKKTAKKKPTGLSPTKKMAKKEAIGASPAVQPFTFLCNQWQAAGNFFTYRNGMVGEPGYGCGTKQGKIKKSDVAGVEEVGTCESGGSLFRITLT